MMSNPEKIQKVLIANRGEIASRIIRTLKHLNILSVAVYSEADVDSDHVHQADESVLIGRAPVSESYLNSEKIINIALEKNVDAIHPGYGLLSENAEFAKLCDKNGIIFLGPTPNQITQYSLKHTARALAVDNEVPILPGSPVVNDVDEAKSYVDSIGFPLMIKSSAGGGGIGMALCHSESDFEKQMAEVMHLSQVNFKNSSSYLERFVTNARHVEVQVFGDGKGGIIPLGLRDCSLQRRNQKVVEETPAPGLSAELESDMVSAAIRITSAAKYRSAGTVEFIYDVDRDQFYFLEVNTRLQVEHGVTEEIYGIDLVEWMVRLQGDPDFEFPNPIPSPKGHSIQVRVYAEDPAREFQPSVGTLCVVNHPQNVRCDSWVYSGTEICSHYDPLISKVIVHAENRDDAIQKMQEALDSCQFEGIETNLEYLKQIIANPVFTGVSMTTAFLGGLKYVPKAIEVLKAGTMTTLQDYPGRTGYWDVGIPPSGPMDSASFRLANYILGNKESACGLEFTNDGATLLFHQPTYIALCGAEMFATLDDQPILFGRPIFIQQGQVLKIGKLVSGGVRAYMAIKGGFEVTPYLGSRATFTLGQFGGHAGRALRAGDMIHHEAFPESESNSGSSAVDIPVFSHEWEILVVYGPHGSPDYFLKEDIESFLASTWEVHYNSARTGIRLIGPKPQWARKDGGEAGLHPSNIHDNAYAIGAIDFTGDMPVILGVDGPSLGGFVCPFTVIEADLWKLGQLRPGDKIKFTPVSDSQNSEYNSNRIKQLLAGQFSVNIHPMSLPDSAVELKSPIIHFFDEPIMGEEVIVRRSGDRNILIEFGAMVLDLKLRILSQLLYDGILRKEIVGITNLTPGIRSLQVQFNPRVIASNSLIQSIEELVQSINSSDIAPLPSRIVHLPLSWNDSSIQKAIDIYQQSVRKGAPWYPSNIEFIQRINGLNSINEVKDIIFNANYLVMGLGDVYLGAPVAVPLDPRHRLVTTKYNPARTWTPENAVGIGGAYLCVYGMEGPGGYQLFGRTLQMWNKYRVTREFPDGFPWLLRFFDQIKFYPVSENELSAIRRDFIHGLYPLKIEQTEFSWTKYSKFLDDNQSSISAFQSKQREAFNAERERWAVSGLDEGNFDEAPPTESLSVEVPNGCESIECVLTGTVWKILAKAGDKVHPDKPIMILEAMKMEVPVYPLESGILEDLIVSEGQGVNSGQVLGFIRQS